MRVYLRANFKVSTIILTSFRQVGEEVGGGGGGNFNLPPSTPQIKVLKSLPRLRLRHYAIFNF